MLPNFTEPSDVKLVKILIKMQPNEKEKVPAMI